MLARKADSRSAFVRLYNAKTLALPTCRVRFHWMSANDPAGDAPATWRELAVARSLDPARVRAENRVQRFLDAALELLTSASDREFTVQEVVERSGQSLRSFYQYFAGKHELLLALFEDAVRTTAEQLREELADAADPLDRLHRFVVSYYRRCQPPAKGKASKGNPAPALAEFAQQLLTSHPDAAARAFAPIVALFEEVLDEAAAAGVIRPDMPHSRLAGVVLQAVMFNAFAAIIAQSSTREAGPDAPEELWDLLMHGIGVAPAR
jgi:AcrR family transcriptional regulator